MKITPVIMSGGSGTRLWPASRHTLPKQFHRLTGEKTLFASTIDRIAGKDFLDPIIVSNEEHRFLVAEELRQANIDKHVIILEPHKKDTAPALLIAALKAYQQNSESVILALPCDHFIDDTELFIETVKQGLPLLEQNYFVTFGVSPTHPATGYGYIKKGSPLSGNDQGFQVASFTEKPTLVKAETFLESGDYLWNSGIFLYKAKDFIKALEQLSPEMVQLCRSSLNAATTDLNFLKLEPTSFSKIAPISIDYALWEKVDNIATLALNCQWSDIGNWNALSDIKKPDPVGNVTEGNVLALESENCVAMTDGPLTALLGVKDLIVVANDDAILVCDKSKSEEIKKLVAIAEERKFPQAREHSKIYRPWGWYKTIESGPRHKVKHISVKTGSALSLQKHNHRAEHWIVVSGVATVTKGQECFELLENQSTYISIGVLHRLENKGETTLKIIEIQTGDYLEEDDIVRYEDLYKRN